MTPEAETGFGPVDFKFSIGDECKILVELKLSSNKKLRAGYEKQIQAYHVAEKAIHSFYVIINFLIFFK